jgi:hypothetical protein
LLGLRINAAPHVGAALLVLDSAALKHRLGAVHHPAAIRVATP